MAGSPEDISSSPVPSERDEEDPGLKILNARKRLELRKKMAQSATAKASESNLTNNRNQKSEQVSDRDLILRALTERGDEVLAAAEAAYPNQMRTLVPAIAKLIRQGKVTTISGGEMLHFLRSIGLRVSVPTSITVQEHGKFVSLADKLKSSD
jgi:hypothetical protein